MKKILLIMTLLMFSSTCSYHCDDCDCMADEIVVKVANNYSYYTNQEYYNIEEVKSFYLIKTEKGNINTKLDTIVYKNRRDLILRYEKNLNEIDSFFKPSFDKYDYILKSDSPYFEHTITDIELHFKKFKFLRNKCTCGDPEITYKIDGTEMKSLNNCDYAIKKQ